MLLLSKREKEAWTNRTINAKLVFFVEFRQAITLDKRFRAMKRLRGHNVYMVRDGCASRLNRSLRTPGRISG